MSEAREKELSEVKKECVRQAHEAAEWRDVCRRIYDMFPTVTKLEVNPTNLLGFMVGIQHRLERAEKECGR